MLKPRHGNILSLGATITAQYRLTDDVVKFINTIARLSLLQDQLCWYAIITITFVRLTVSPQIQMAGMCVLLND